MHIYLWWLIKYSFTDIRKIVILLLKKIHIFNSPICFCQQIDDVWHMSVFCSHMTRSVCDCLGLLLRQLRHNVELWFVYFSRILYISKVCMCCCRWIVNVRKIASVCGPVTTRTTVSRTSTTSAGHCCVRFASWLRTTGKTSISWCVSVTVYTKALFSMHQTTSVSLGTWFQNVVLCWLLTFFFLHVYYKHSGLWDCPYQLLLYLSETGNATLMFTKE